jgi:hypothetical protein
MTPMQLRAKAGGVGTPEPPGDANFCHHQASSPGVPMENFANPKRQVKIVSNRNFLEELEPKLGYGGRARYSNKVTKAPQYSNSAERRRCLSPSSTICNRQPPHAIRNVRVWEHNSRRASHTIVQRCRALLVLHRSHSGGAARVAQVSLWSQRAVLNATYSSLRMRTHAFKMPLQVKLNFEGKEEHTIEFPDDATVLKVMEWANERYGWMEVDRVRVITVKASKVLKKEELLSSNPDFLNLNISYRNGGG